MFNLNHIAMLPSKKVQNWLPGVVNDFIGNNEWLAKLTGAPAMNIIESDKDYKVEVALPGVTKEEVKVQIDDNDMLVVNVTKKKESTQKDAKTKYLRHEFSFSQFEQSVSIPENSNKDAIEAEQIDGVLTITIPKKEVTPAANKKDIAIK